MCRSHRSDYPVSHYLHTAHLDEIFDGCYTVTIITSIPTNTPVHELKSFELACQFSRSLWINLGLNFHFNHPLLITPVQFYPFVVPL